jgi:hypothetical protein
MTSHNNIIETIFFQKDVFSLISSKLSLKEILSLRQTSKTLQVLCDKIAPLENIFKKHLEFTRIKSLENPNPMEYVWKECWNLVIANDIKLDPANQFNNLICLREKIIILNYDGPRYVPQVCDIHNPALEAPWKKQKK